MALLLHLMALNGHNIIPVKAAIKYLTSCGYPGSHPKVFVPSGIMERGNLSTAAGFGFNTDKFGVFSMFSVFLEMVKELT
ncbi:hypothetical protein DFH29DRAFT_1009025 [Suillus ampliporus]|nr:hypothetical protein DFH29DRAFT_1009025 [Suillus ampliporus]